MSYFTDGNILLAADLNDLTTDTVSISDSSNSTIIDLDKTGVGIGNPIDIINDGSDPTISCDNTSTGDFIEYKDNGSVKFEIENDGAMNAHNNRIDDIDSVIFRNNTSTPSTTEGDVYYDSTNNMMKYYNGSVWVMIK